VTDVQVQIELAVPFFYISVTYCKYCVCRFKRFNRFICLIFFLYILYIFYFFKKFPGQLNRLEHLNRPILNFLYQPLKAVRVLYPFEDKALDNPVHPVRQHPA